MDPELLAVLRKIEKYTKATSTNTAILVVFFVILPLLAALLFVGNL